MRHCSRCRVPANILTCSMFNTEMICINCKDIEREHPSYKAACDAERAAVLSGDYNFPGIGLPKELKKTRKSV